MTYEIHTDIASSCTKDEDGMFAGVEGEYRVKNVMVGDEKLDLEKTYSLASINYTLTEHGDGFTMFDGCKVLQKGSQTDLQVLINYLTDTLGGAVSEAYKDPYGQGRIIEVAGNAEETER
jgi:2',3'-cyclic-nucleotide 2'-phosphodiesterase (5'-nucleotidase family)